MEILLAAALGCLLDALLADPAWMPHPVVLMGRCITALERGLRRIFPQTPEGERRAGACLAVILPLGTLAVCGGAIFLANLIHPALAFVLQVLWCWQALAARGLVQESCRVLAELEKGDLESARKAVSRIVGRDTQALTAQGVTKAAVETVAENFSDGVVAPLFYLMIGGVPLGMMYKAVNTMDSMVGYKNDRYLHFGRYAAKLDDVANYLPSRLSALLLLAGGVLTGGNGKNGWRIWRRDRRNHASPNSAQTEAACAGLLEIQLAGNASYFGKVVEKPTIGDPVRPVEPEDIRRANRMMMTASLLALLLLSGGRLAVVTLLG
mgnify:FL=1